MGYRLLLATLGLVLGASTLAPVPAALGQGETAIAIQVREWAGVARAADPVTVGVPLAIADAIRDPEQLMLTDADGRRAPAQMSVLSRWNGPAGDARLPIRWLAVHFQADVPAAGIARYRLQYAVPGTATGAPLARATGSGVDVDTGAIAFHVASDAFRLVEDVRIDIDGDGAPDFDIVARGHDGGVFVQRTDGSLHAPADDAENVVVTVEENGPLTTTVRVDGRHRSGTADAVRMREGRAPHDWLEFTARIHAYRGKPWVRIEYALRNPDRFFTEHHNRGGDPVYHEIESLSLVLPLRTLGDPLTLTLGGEAPLPWAPAGATPPDSAPPAWTLPLPAGSTAALYQDSSGGDNWQDAEDQGASFRGYLASLDRTPLGRGNHAAGWGDVSALAWGVTVGVDDFWQNFPKGLRFTGDGQIAIDLWPAQFRTPHRIEGGRQKTHRLLLDFHRRAGADVAAYTSFAAPLRATVAPERYRDSLALGPVATLPVNGGPEIWRLRGMARALLDPESGMAAERERFDLYGWRDWGDSYRAGDAGHRAFGNNEFDFGWSLQMLHLLGEEQDPRFLELAEPLLDHLRDIDIYHTDEDAPAYAHGIRQHDGSGTTGHSREPILSHAWIRGLLTAYWTRGDRSALDAALEVGRWVEGLVDARTGELAWHGQSRSQAWAALALTELWEATGEARYLDLAGRLLGREVIADQGGADSPLPCAALDWEGDAGEREREDTSPWQNGYVAAALGRYTLARRLAGAADRAAEEGLFRLLDDLERCGYATPDNGGFVPGDEDRDDELYGRRYRSLVIDRIYADGRWTIRYPNNHLLTDGFAYGALFTPDPARRQRWLEMAHETWIWTMGPESAPGDARGTPTYCCPETPAKNAAMDLRFGWVWRWVRERMEPPTRP